MGSALELKSKKIYIMGVRSSLAAKKGLAYKSTQTSLDFKFNLANKVRMNDLANS